MSDHKRPKRYELSNKALLLDELRLLGTQCCGLSLYGTNHTLKWLDYLEVIDDKTCPEIVEVCFGHKENKFILRIL